MKYVDEYRDGDKARALAAAIAAEPVPERLRELAAELGEMIHRQREKGDTQRSD